MQPKFFHGLSKREMLIAKPRNYYFMTQELVFLGHVVSKYGLKLDPDIIKTNYKMPVYRIARNSAPSRESFHNYDG